MIQFGFYAWPLFAIGMLTFLLYRGNKKLWLPFLEFMVFAWAVYLFVMNKSGLLNDPGLPPRVPLLVVLPAVAISLFANAQTGFRKAQSHLPLWLPIMMQGFRVGVEFLIYGGYKEGVFPRLSTFEGLNFDIVAGASALIVGFLAMRGLIGRRGLLIWNFAALAVLILTVFSFMYAYYLADIPYFQISDGFTRLPFLLLPGVLLPVAIFLHIFSIRQLIARKHT